MSRREAPPDPPEQDAARWLELVESLVHGLRTPLATVSGYLELLADDPSGLDERRREQVARAAQGARELGRQLELAALAARFEARTVETKLERRELVAVVDLALLRLGEDELARLDWRGRAAGAVSCDAALLGRSVLALITRALARAAEEERIELLVAREGDRLRVEVRDRGAPIPPGQLDDLFGIGAPAGARPRSPRLELLVGRRIAEAHGGRTGASSADGVTRLWLELPGLDGERNA